MQTKDNTILITGGGSGIGRGLAEAFHKLGNQIIVSGRKQGTLDAVVAANPGVRALTVDMADAGSVREFAARRRTSSRRSTSSLTTPASLFPRTCVTSPPTSPTWKRWSPPTCSVPSV